jgi:predicted PolB exonuclease-like 3'-5' exonuclease
MGNYVLVWDLETVPDLAAVARVNGFEEGDETAARAVVGDKIPKLPYHQIACIGALVAERVGPGWEVRSLGAPHCGERTEAELLQSFVDRIDELRPQLVTYNGGSFDLPVLRYRAMMRRVRAPGLAIRPYFNRYTTDALDLCDALACFDSRGKMSLHELCRALGFPGKPDGIDGSEVSRYVVEGRVHEVAGYCETDVVSTYRVWLVYELFRGALTIEEFLASEANLREFLQARSAVRPHLRHLLGEAGIAVSPVAALGAESSIDLSKVVTSGSSWEDAVHEDG